MRVLYLILVLFICIMMPNAQAEEKYEKATFAGGCFWCMEAPFSTLDGVSTVTSGYLGGKVENPAYEEVSTGTTGHREVIQIVYDPSRITYPELVELFWRQIDPTDASGQFADRGTQYTTAIFYHSEAQRKLAQASKEKLDNSGKFDKPIVTEILEASVFYEAEPYHQDYKDKNPIKYKQYEEGSGRASYKKEVWN